MSVNVSIKLRKGESQDKLLKRFNKKCRKEEVIKEYLDKTSFFKTKTQKKREKRRKNQYLRSKGKKIF